jgi:predicted RNase H-like nuclease (RuvC/YqgF family)
MAANTTISAKLRGKREEKDKDTLAEVNKQLSQISKDLAELKCEIKKTVKEEKLETLVTDIVKKILQQNINERDESLKAEFEKKTQELEREFQQKTDKMCDNIQKLESRAETLTEKLAENNKEIRELKQKLENTEKVSREALRLSNKNEQYSRKFNFKITGLKEQKLENTDKLTKDFIKDKTGVHLDDHEVVAIHRIPGAPGKPRPILVKVVSLQMKTKIMRKRSVIKNLGSGQKLVDDVTKANAELIADLTEHSGIEAAWYFNGSVFAKVKGCEKKIRFDITDDLERKIRKNSK